MSVKAKRGLKVSFKGIDVEDLVLKSIKDITPILGSRVNRRVNKHGLGQRHIQLLRKIRKANSSEGKGKMIKTHLRDMIVFPEMIGTTIAVHNGHHFFPVEIKPHMVGYYLGDFALSYKTVKHGKVGIGATRSSKFVPLR